MKKIVIDTNCMLSFVTDRNLEQQEKISKLLHEAGQLKVSVLCHCYMISEFVFVLSSVYGTDVKKIHEIISDLIVMPGIMTVAEVNMQTVLSLWPAVVSDYGDAIIAAYSKNTKGTAVATFDKKFSKAMHRAGIAIHQL